MSAAAPFGTPERMLAWRYLRAKRSEGGISIIAWFSFFGILLSVGTLIVVMAVMVGFRAEFVSRILGVNGHTSLISYGGREVGFTDYEPLAATLDAAEGVTLAAPVMKGQVMATRPGGDINSIALVRGMRLEDLRRLPGIADPEEARGSLDDFETVVRPVAIGSGLAQELGLIVGDEITLISPKGLTTAVGTNIRRVNFNVVYIFRVGMSEYDKILVYMPLELAQAYFLRRDRADEIDIFVESPDAIEALEDGMRPAIPANSRFWNWKQANGAFIAALNTERVMMFVILSLLVVIAVLNIITGLVMLVKNKGRDIAILRTVGLTRRGVMRVFFMCGAVIGVAGTLFGVVAGVLFAIFIQPIMEFVAWITGQNLWDPSIRQLTELPAKLRAEDILAVMALSITFSLIATLIPSWRAARLDPVEALRNE